LNTVPVMPGAAACAAAANSSIAVAVTKGSSRLNEAAGVIFSALIAALPN